MGHYFTLLNRRSLHLLFLLFFLVFIFGNESDCLRLVELSPSSGSAPPLLPLLLLPSILLIPLSCPRLLLLKLGERFIVLDGRIFLSTVVFLGRPKLVRFIPVVFLAVPLTLLVDRFKILIKCLEPSETGIETILDVIIYSTWHKLLDLHPLVAVLFVKLHQLDVFSNCPFLFIEIWVNIIIPSLTALFANASRQKGGNLLPFLESEQVNLFLENLVLLIGPVALHSFCVVLILEENPSLQALVLSLGVAKLIVLDLWNLLHFVADEFIQDRRNLIHLVDAILIHQVGQLCILRGCPMVEFGLCLVSVIFLIV